MALDGPLLWRHQQMSSNWWTVLLRHRDNHTLERWMHFVESKRDAYDEDLLLIPDLNCFCSRLYKNNNNNNNTNIYVDSSSTITGKTQSHTHTPGMHARTHTHTHTHTPYHTLTRSQWARYLHYICLFSVSEGVCEVAVLENLQQQGAVDRQRHLAVPYASG